MINNWYRLIINLFKFNFQDDMYIISDNYNSAMNYMQLGAVSSKEHNPSIN